MAGLAAMLTVSGTAQAGASPSGPPVRLFGASELHRGTSRALPKWSEALSRHQSDLEAGGADCASGRPGDCGPAHWQALLAQLQGKTRRRQLDLLNQYVNRAPYVSDSANYGQGDYWASPRELFTRGGDCEDYAIAKFLALRTLGVSQNDMRVVVLEDGRRREIHAALVVFLDGERWLLDNQLSQVVPVDAITHYRPIYAIDGENWILYRTSAAPGRERDRQPAAPTPAR